jgi:sporulation protein YlmC with PRC-barrel domain
MARRDYEQPTTAGGAAIQRDTRSDWGEEHRFRRVMSAGTLAGDRVRNSAGEDLGKLEEIMLDVPSGRVAYAVLSFGGFLGMGSKLFAIPWEALKLNEADKEFVLDIDKARLESAPGFEKDNWPDMADPQFGSEIYGYYGYKPYWDK